MKFNQLKIPDIKVDNQERQIVTQINENIKIQLNNIIQMQQDEISKEKIRKVEIILSMSNQLIIDCHTLREFKISKNTNFSRLVYEHQRLNSKYEIFKMQSQMDKVKCSYEEITSKQKALATESGNLVYNILGFIASFSIVSAAVVAIQNIHSIIDIMIFMAFTAFILITTLIGLNNFYKVRDMKTTKLQDNYFLWKMTVFVIIMLIMCKGVIYIKNNEERILECIGKGIGTVIENNKEKT